MKFAELISQKITNPQAPNNVQGLIGWYNSTNSHFLVLSLFPVPYYGDQFNSAIPNSTGSYGATIGDLLDPNGYTVAHFYAIRTFIQQFNDSMTVWNGTAMENEPQTHTTMTTWMFRMNHLLIPPAYTLADFDFGMGYFLTDEEVREFILRGAIPSQLEVVVK